MYGFQSADGEVMKSGLVYLRGCLFRLDNATRCLESGTDDWSRSSYASQSRHNIADELRAHVTKNLPSVQFLVSVWNGAGSSNNNGGGKKQATQHSNLLLEIVHLYQKVCGYVYESD